MNVLSSEVWKWIIQIGSARAGWYSLDWIDNADIQSASTVYVLLESKIRL